MYGGAAGPQLQWTSQAVIISVWASVEDPGQTMNLSGLPIAVSQAIAIDERLSNELQYSYTLPIYDLSKNFFLFLSFLFLNLV